MSQKFKLFDYFKIPKKYKTEINRKNKFVLRVLFFIALGFGLSLFIVSLLTHRESIVVGYYASYMILGAVGLLLTLIKVPNVVLQAIVLCFIEYIFTYMLGRTSVENTVITFFAFLFIYIMVMHINPFMFVAILLAYFALIPVLIKINIITTLTDKTVTFIGNLIMIILINIYLAFWKSRHFINEINRDMTLAEETEKTDLLLHNIFPQKVINQLKENGKSLPENYENVTVLFADIVDFTKTSNSLDPKIVIDELNDIFTEFDKITEKNFCMRIKTVGDAYLAVCGLPDKNEKHAEQLILCAREYISFLVHRNQTAPIKWNIRIGIDSGNAIAGIIGLKKYVYDILGSTVDTAVKMEQSCAPMRIAVSQKTYELIKDILTSKEKEGIDLINPTNEA